MKKITLKNLLKYLVPIFAPVLFIAIGPYAYAKDDNISNVENNVRAEANTGGNKIEGWGNIETGDARAKAKSVNIVNNDGESSVKAEAKAEADGGSVEIRYEGSGPADIHKKSSDGLAEAGIEINKNIEDQPRSENGKKSFFENVWNFISSIF